MKTSNEALASEWTLACTGLKLCPPFNTRSSEGTIGTLDTALNRSRRFTIHCDKRGLCAGEVTWKRTDKTPFIIPPGKRHPRTALPRETALSDDNRTKGEPESQRLQRDMDPISLGLPIWVDTTLTHLFAPLRLRAAHETQPNFVRKGGFWRNARASHERVNTETGSQAKRTTAASLLIGSD